MANKTTDAYQYLLRLPKPLAKRLVAQAKRNNVSLNTEIVQRLQGYERQATRYAADLADNLMGEVQKRATQVAAECVLQAVREAAPSPPTHSELERRLKSMEMLLRAAETGKPDEK